MSYPPLPSTFNPLGIPSSYDFANLPEETGQEPLVGYRAWKVQQKDDKYYLKSAVKDVLWPHKQKLIRGEKLPKERIELGPGVFGYYQSEGDLSLGIHSVKEKHKLGVVCADYEKARIGGSIWMWGEVIETQNGYLAQYAYPKELYVMSDMDPTIIMELEHSYGVAVQVSETLEECYKLECEHRKAREALLGTMYKTYTTYYPLTLSSSTLYNPYSGLGLGYRLGYSAQNPANQRQGLPPLQQQPPPNPRQTAVEQAKAEAAEHMRQAALPPSPKNKKPWYKP